MLKEETQKYGIYIPELKVFMYVDCSKDEFQKILKEAGLDCG